MDWNPFPGALPTFAALPGMLLAEIQTGGYVSIVKTVVLLIVLLVWARLLTWADKDAQAAHLPRVELNVGMLAGMIAAFVLFFYLPGFLIAFPLLLVIFGAEAAAYLTLRQKKVGLGDLKAQFNDWVKSLTEGKGKKKEVKEPPHFVSVINKGGSPLPTPAEETPERGMFDALQQALSDPLRKGAEQIEIQPAEGATAVRYYVDGMQYRGAVLDRANAAGAIAMLKSAAGLDVNDRRKPQRGAVKLGVGGKRQEFRIDTAGSTAGEAARLLLDPKKRHEIKLEDLGLGPKQLEHLRSVIKERKGVVLVAAPKGQGLTTLLYSIVRAHDAFLEHIHTIERDPETELDGITQNKLPSSAGGSEEAKLAGWVVSQEPDVILAPRLEDARTAQELINFAKNEGKRVYVGLRASSTFEALDQWRKIVGDDRAATEALELVIAGRVLRRLCLACKVPYAPDPGTLRKLNMDPTRVDKLFQARSQPMRDAKGNPIPCTFCSDLRYRGRIGVYETMTVDDDVRQAVKAGGSTNQLKTVFRKQKGRYLQEEALALVERGETSVQEVLRVLRGGDAPPPPQQAASPAPAPAPAPGSRPSGGGGVGPARPRPAPR